MWPMILPGLISGGASLLGNIFSSQTSAQNTQEQIYGQSVMQQSAQNFNAQQADINRQFQAQMSNTAYQRATKDMEAAGINPVLAAGGQAASSPSGSTASVSPGTMPVVNKPSAWAGLGQAVSSGIDAMVHSQFIDKMSSEIASLQAEKAKTDATTSLLKGQQKIQDPEVRQAMIRMGYPDWLANALTYGHDVSKGVEGAGDAFWSLIPGGKFFRSIVGGGSAKASAPLGESGDKSFTPTQNRRIMDIIDETKSTSAKTQSSSPSSLLTDTKAMAKMKADLDKAIREMGPLGGRNPGTAGSYD